MKQPCYIGLEEARQVSAEWASNSCHTPDTARRRQDAQGRRKLPFFVDPIEHKLKIEKDDLLSAYFKTASRSAEKPPPKLNRTVLKLAFRPIFIALFAMADIRKRNGKKGTTYLVRYPSKARKCGYEHKSFDTMKEARQFVEQDLSQTKAGRRATVISASVEDAIKKWLETCRHEGRQGKDPVSPATAEVYEYRAEIMKAYNWDKALQELEAPDIVAFRSWLLKNYSRDQAKKTLSSFHSVLLEMVTQGSWRLIRQRRITIQQSRYQEPVEISSVEEDNPSFAPQTHSPVTRIIGLSRRGRVTAR